MSMDKHEALIAKETVLRAIDGNLRAAIWIVKNIEYLMWMHPELDDYEHIEQLSDELRSAIETFRDYLAENHIGSERKLEDAIIALHGTD